MEEPHLDDGPETSPSTAETRPESADPDADSSEPADTAVEPDAADDAAAALASGAAAAVRPSRFARLAAAPLWAKLCLGLGALLVLVSGGALAAVHLVSNRYEGAVTRSTLLAPDARRTGDAGGGILPTTVRGPLNFLLIGSDFRARIPEEGQRADTIIIVHVPESMDRAYLISIPRDLLVEIPAYPPTGFEGDEAKINAAYAYGGAPLLSMTLSQLTGIRFDGAAIINFDGFRRAVDVLGGVYMCVDREVESIHLGYDEHGNVLQLWADEEGRLQGLPRGGRPYVHEAGCRRMNGMLALDYSRTRYGLPSGDYDRQQNQQEFLKAVFQEATKQGLATNPVKLDQFLRAVGSALTVDTGEVGLTDLLFSLRNVTPSLLVGVRVPSYPDTLGGVSYILPDAPATTLYRAIRDDTLADWATVNPTWVNPL